MVAATLGLVLAPGAFALALLLALPRLRFPLPPGTLWMAIGTLVWMVPPLLRGATATLLHDLQVVALILIVAAVSTLPLERRLPSISLGVLIGLTMLAIFSLLQLGGVVSALLSPFVDNEGWSRLAESSAAAAASGRASGWMDHPNLWAARSLVPGMFVLAIAGGPPWRLAVALPAVLIALAAGSRASLLGLGLGLLLLGLLYLGRRPFDVRRFALVGFALVTLAALALLPPWGARVRALFDVITPEDTSQTTPYNLLNASADLEDASWFERGVEVERLADSEQRAWIVRKTLAGMTSRLQQRIELAPGDHTLSAELLIVDPASQPGVIIFWRDRSGVAHGLTVRHIDGRWQTSSQGSLELLSVETTPLDDGWLHLDIAFRTTSSDRDSFPIGLTPDRRQVIGSTLGVRDLQLVLGTAPLPYQPTLPVDSTRLQAQASAQGRGRIFAAAWSGFVARPLIGQGGDAFPDWYRDFAGNDRLFVGHAHNLLLQTLFARGVVGLLGLTLLLLGLVVAARGAPGFLIVLIAVLAANVFDTTLWTAGQSYLLAVAAGWYAGRSPRQGTGKARPSV